MRKVPPHPPRNTPRDDLNSPWATTQSTPYQVSGLSSLSERVVFEHESRASVRRYPGFPRLDLISCFLPVLTLFPFVNVLPEASTSDHHVNRPSRASVGQGLSRPSHQCRGEYLEYSRSLRARRYPGPGRRLEMKHPSELYGSNPRSIPSGLWFGMLQDGSVQSRKAQMAMLQRTGMSTSWCVVIYHIQMAIAALRSVS